MNTHIRRPTRILAIAVGVAALVMAAATAVAAAPPAAAAPPDPASEFRKLDKNGDGKLSRTEAKAKAELELNFDSLDTNHDGSLTADEFGKSNAPVDPTTAPSGSGNAQHMPKT